MAYAENYARVLLDQWGVGGCGEEVLLFVVQRRPKEVFPISLI
jgi:hypothetical protein